MHEPGEKRETDHREWQHKKGTAAVPGKTVAWFIKQREQYRGLDYLCCTVGYHVAPVLETHRPAVLLSFGGGRRRLVSLWEENKYTLLPAGEMSFYELNKTGKRIRILFYHRLLLEQLLRREDIRAFLLGFGYSRQAALLEMLARLQWRFQRENCPPELGIFLGIPLGDVQGFVVHRGKYSWARGCWKVYTDLPRALTIFSRCEEAKLHFLKFIQHGYPPAAYLRIHAAPPMHNQ